MATSPPVDPRCRYDHGSLFRVHDKGQVPEWGLISPQSPFPGTGFLLALYVCPTCGYAEFFDLDPAKTMSDEKLA
jgi:hypothetical protein